MSEPASQLESSAPLEAVIRRLDKSAGFPTLSTTITDINRIVASDSEGVTKLTRTILRDVSMTNKLLHVVNSASFGQFRGRVHTVSKAVLLLGFDAVRNIAMTLMMLKFSEEGGQNRTMRDEIVTAYFAGVVSRSICNHLNIRHSEEAMICTMFQNLGRLIATFFMYEDSLRVVEHMKTGMGEEVASLQVLGISYRDLGIGVAKHWNFPERLIEGMHPVSARDVASIPRTDVARLKIAANLANELCATVLSSNEAEKSLALESLTRRYSGAVKLKVTDLSEAIQASLKEFSDSAPALNLPVKHSKVLGTISNWVDAGSGDAPDDDAISTMTEVDGALLSGICAVQAIDQVAASDQDPEQVLSNGIRDVTETLVADFALNDVLQMVLETMYRGMRFSHSMIFIRDNKAGVMRARFGFGANVETMIAKCAFPLAFAPDVFHVSIDKGVDIIIDDARADNIVDRIPAWHKQAVTARGFLLLPVAVKNQVIGLFYADWDRADGPRISAQQLGLLRTLRSQVVLAFKQRA